MHRARIFANHLPSFGWESVILTVDERYYEEPLDWNLHKLLPKNLRIEKVKAMRIRKPRLIGDIGLRAFFSMLRKAERLIIEEKFDFLYITIPSFYGALWGRWLHATTGIPYGIDYIDPWVHEFPGASKVFSRAWLATKVSKLLEPIAVKKASLISGVAEGYFEGVIERNPKLARSCKFLAVPYGIEKADNDAVKNLKLSSYLFNRGSQKIKMIYAGALLPKAFTILEAVFGVIEKEHSLFKNVEFHFIGTGVSLGKEVIPTVKPYAEKHHLWKKQVFEHPERIPYLDVLIHLDAADGVFIIGSTEPHYTPSKVYQAILAKKPIFAILHRESTAVEVIRNSLAGYVLTIDGLVSLNKTDRKLKSAWKDYDLFRKSFVPDQVKGADLLAYSGEHITHELASALNECLVQIKS